MAGPQGSKAYEVAIRNPQLGAMAELRQRAQEKLINFIRYTWHILEPGQPLRVGWAMEAISEHLEAVHKGQIRNLLINCPPGFSKSTLVNVFFPAWEWGPRNRPDLRYISWSYGEHLTHRDNEKCHKLIDHPLYQALWGGRFRWDKKQNAIDYYKTSAEGFRVASGVRGMGTGERGDRLHVDDPHSVAGADSEADILFANNWFTATLTSRVRNANPYDEFFEGVMVKPSSTIVIMQRLRHNDVSGIILANELNFEHLLIEMEYEGAKHPARARLSKKTGKPAWRPSAIGYVDPRERWCAMVDAAIINFNASLEARGDASPAASDDIWWDNFLGVWLKIARDIACLADPVRYSRAAVEEHREKLLLKEGSNAVAAQFRQWPSEGLGELFPVDKWTYCDPQDVPPSRVIADVSGWDLAASETLTSDGTARVKMRWGSDRKFYVFIGERIRGGPGAVKQFRDRARAEDGPTVIQDFPQDPGQAGVDQVNTIRQEDVSVPVRSSPETGSKATRALPYSAQQNLGNVVLVRGAWTQAYVEEHGEFPYARMNALVDASSRAFNRLASMPALQVPGGTILVEAASKGERFVEAYVQKPKLNPAIDRPEVDSDLDDDLD